MDSLYLTLGKFIFWAILFFMGAVLIFCIGIFLWMKVIRYFWYMVRKIILPEDASFIDGWRKAIDNAPPESWRHYVKIFQKGKWFMWYSPKSKIFLNRVVFGRIKNESSKRK